MAPSGQPPMGPYQSQGMAQGGPGQPLPPHQNFDREREAQEGREREMRDREYEAQMRQRDAREREMRDRQGRDPLLPPHQNHAEQLQLHQPVAVGPQVRAMHGPNGLLGQPGNPGNPASAPNGHMPLFGPHYETPSHGGMPTGPPPPANAMGFGPTTHASIAALGPGQQPILNVSHPGIIAVLPKMRHGSASLTNVHRMLSATSIKSRFSSLANRTCIISSSTS